LEEGGGVPKTTPKRNQAGKKGPWKEKVQPHNGGDINPKLLWRTQKTQVGVGRDTKPNPGFWVGCFPKKQQKKKTTTQLKKKKKKKGCVSRWEHQVLFGTRKQRKKIQRGGVGRVEQPRAQKNWLCLGERNKKPQGQGGHVKKKNVGGQPQQGVQQQKNPPNN